jgi:hypothetical protein
MRRLALLTATVFALVAGSASAAAPQAAQGRLGGLGASLFGNSYFNFSQPNLKAFAVSTIRFGKVRIDLQHTKLTDVQRAYGGTIYQQGQGNGIARWLCYQSPQAATWLMTNSLGGGEFVMMVATAAGQAQGSCDAIDAPLPDFGIPGLGASTGELQQHFGSVPQSGRGSIGYRADRPARDGLGTANDAQYIGYVTSGGRVAGVGVGATTAQ